MQKNESFVNRSVMEAGLMIRDFQIMRLEGKIRVNDIVNQRVLFFIVLSAGCQK